MYLATSSRSAAAPVPVPGSEWPPGRNHLALVSALVLFPSSHELANQVAQGAIVSETVGLPVDAPARLTLYIPHPESRLCTELAHGSAIVGLPLAHGEIRIYFEGNVIGA